MKIALTACFAVTIAATATTALAQDAGPVPSRNRVDVALLADPGAAPDLPSLPVNYWNHSSDESLSSETVPAGVPLRVQLDKSYPLRVGTRVEGHLMEPVYLVDHVAIPQNSKVFGRITAKQPVSAQTRTAAMLNGDLTPLKKAVATFDELETPDGRRFSIQTDATERTTQTVHMSDENAKPRRNLLTQVADALRWTRNQAVAVLTMEHKTDRMRQFLYQEIPFHPQEIWAGTQYDAELTQPIVLTGQSVPAPAPSADLAELKLEGTIEARLLTSVDSASAQPGTPVEAVLTEPLFESAPTVATDLTRPRRKMLLPEGTRLIGAVVRAKAAARFGRNGSLRFTFRKAELPQGDQRIVHGQVAAAETKDAHIKIDDEGGVKAVSGSSRFFEPISLGALAAVGDSAAAGAVRELTAGNGMDLVSQVVSTALPTAGLVTGFAYYEVGKVVFDQWIARGHDVVFQKNTRLEIELAQR